MILNYVDSTQFDDARHTARLFELEDLNTYVFQNADGTRTVYFLDENVKYVNSKGQTVEKDLSLVANKQGYSISQSDIGLTMSNDPRDGIRLDYLGHTVTITPITGNTDITAVKKDNSIVYTGIFGANASLKYTPLLSGVKEDIILSSYIPNASYSFTLDTDGLYLCEKDGKYFLAESAAGKPLFYLGDIITYDAIGKPSEGTLTVKTISAGSEYTITVAADEAFLSDPTTVYPVTIDPSITISDNTHGANAIEDSPIFEGYPDRNFGTYLYNRVGTPNSTYGVGRTVVKLSGLINSDTYQSITANQITSVSFYAKESSGGSEQFINLYPLTSNTTWTESTVTWNNVGSHVTTVNYGVSMYNGRWTEFNITELVKAWKNGTYSANAGFIMTNENETGNNKSFYSSECSTPGNRPYVVMTYEPVFCGGNSFDTAEVITLNTYHTVNIDTQYGLKYFEFTPSTTGFYTFESSSNLSADPYARLYNASKEQIAYNDDGASDRNFRLTYHLKLGITYYFTAGCYSSYTGIYDFKIVKTTSSNQVSASSVYIGSQTSVSIDLSYRAKYYKFTPSVTGEYLFVSSDNSADPRMWLYDSLLNQIDYNDDGAGEYNFKVSITLTAGETYYIVVSQFSDKTGNCKLNLLINRDLGQTIACALYESNAGVIYNFIPKSSGTYYIETEQPNGVGAQDTVVYLMDSNYKLISSNDNKNSSGNKYSKITATLTAGQEYKVLVTSHPDYLFYNCYIAIYQSGSLYAPVSGYAGFVKNFKKIGNYTDTYNCLAYAIGITNSWVWPWGDNLPTISQLDTYMNSKGYVRVSQYQSNCIVAYGFSSSEITHFSKVVAGNVTAKCGRAELMEHNEYDAYFADGDYGTPQAFYVKSSSAKVSISKNATSIININTPTVNVDAYLLGLDMDIAQQVETKLNQLVINQNDLINSFDLVYNNTVAFNEIEELGIESIPYILNYIIKSDNNGLFEAFLIASVAEMLNYSYLPGNIESNCKYSCGYVEYSPKYYAYQILLDIACNSNK